MYPDGSRAQAPSAMDAPTSPSSRSVGTPRSARNAIQSLLGQGLVGMMSSGVERRIVGRHVARIVHRPVARPDAEHRIVRRHPQGVSVLDQPALAASFLVVGDAGERVEIGRLRPPVERVGENQGEGQPDRSHDAQLQHPPAHLPVLPEPADPESLDREERARRRRPDPRGPRAREHQRARGSASRRARPTRSFAGSAPPWTRRAAAASLSRRGAP